MKNVIIFIGILILLVGCAFFAIPIIPSCRYHTTVAAFIGRITPPYGAEKSVFVYYVGNKRNKRIGIDPMYWVPMHEKYLLRYDTLYLENQDHVKVITECPVFLPGEITHYTIGKLLRVHKGHELFDFEYTISGKKYDRLQILGKGNSVRNHPQLVNGAEFLVEYWVQNPQRAILYMDKPKRDGMPFPLSPDIHVLRPVWDSIPVLLPSQHMF